MLQLVDIGLVIFGGLFFLVALSFLIQGVLLRSRAARQLYTVGRQASRREMNTAWLRGLLFLALSVLLLLVWVVAPHPQPVATPATSPALPPTPTTPTASATLPPTATALPATPQPLPSQEPALIAPAVLTLTQPAETSADTARINAPNGLLLRTQPNGPEVLELIADGVQVAVLDGRENVGDLTWQHVRAPSGNVGWVALDFLVFDTP